ncbi:MAG: hypothetical protein ACXWDN_10385 [Limisphaerales bacterium]
MSQKQLIKEIRVGLVELSNAKTVEEKCKIVFMMKVRVELLEKPLVKQRDQRRMAYDKKTRIIKKALKQFLTALDRICAKHGELGDTAVRDKMYAAILKGFIMPERTYKLPLRFGMFTEEADRLVHTAIQRFLLHPEVVAARGLLKNPDERLNAFQDDDVQTSEETDYGEFFGYRGGPLA